MSGESSVNTHIKRPKSVFRSASRKIFCFHSRSEPLQAKVRKILRNAGNQEQGLVLQRTPSRLIPALESDTVSELVRLLPRAASDLVRQQIIDAVVQAGPGGINFRNFHGGRPLSNTPLWQQAMAQRRSEGHTASQGTHNGLTVHPGSRVTIGRRAVTLRLPLVLIGPPAFGRGPGDVADWSNRDLVGRYVVRLFSTILHEARHAMQWQSQGPAQSLGEAGREADAFLLEIETSRRTGLRGQRAEFELVWSNARLAWRDFQRSSQWGRLSREERQSYQRRYQAARRIAQEVLRESR